MSNVLSRFRSISEMEFYKNVTELRCALSGFVMQEKYIPKKWRPILAYPTVNLLNTMMEHIIAANGIYPYSGGKLDHELLHRRKELQAQAVADCEALFDRLQFIMDEFHFSRMGTGLDMGIAPQKELPAQLVYIGTLLEREETLLKDWRHNTKFPDTAKFKPKASLPNGDARYQAPRQAPYTPNAPPAAMPAANDSSAMAAQAMGVNHHHYPH